MQFKYLILFLFVFLINTAHSQNHKSWKYFQLQIEDKSYPYYLALKKENFYFFSIQEHDISPYLVNFGKVNKQKKEFNFQEVIRSEGKTIVWELFSKDSVFFCDENPWIITSNQDTVWLSPNDEGILMPNFFRNLPNVKGAHRESISSHIYIKQDSSSDNNRLHSTTLPSINSLYQKITIDSFIAKDGKTKIKSPKIYLSDPKPHLVLVEFYYPRKNAYRFFHFFPKTEKWTYNRKTKTITAFDPVVVTFFDFDYGHFSEDFGSTDGIYTAPKWEFIKIPTSSMPHDIITRLKKDEETYKKNSIPETIDCVKKADSVKISVYDNPTIDTTTVQENSQEVMKTLHENEK